MHSRNDKALSRYSSNSWDNRGTPRTRGVPFVNVTEIPENSDRQSQNADSASAASPLRGKSHMPAFPLAHRLHLRLHKNAAQSNVSAPNAANYKAVDREESEDRRGTIQFAGTSVVDRSDFEDVCAERSSCRRNRDSFSTASEDIRKLEVELDNLRFQLRMKDEEQKTEDFLSVREDSERGSRRDMRGPIVEELCRLRIENAALRADRARITQLESLNAALATENTQLKHKDAERLSEIHSLKSNVRRHQKKSDTKLHLPPCGSTCGSSSGRPSNGASARSVFNVEEDKMTLRPLEFLDSMSDPYSFSLASQGTSLQPQGRSSPTSSQLSAAIVKLTPAGSAVRNVSFSVCSSDQQTSTQQNVVELSLNDSSNILGTPRTTDDSALRCLSDCPDANCCEVASLSLGSMRTSNIPQGMLSPTSSRHVFSRAAHEGEMKARGESASFSAVGSMYSTAPIGDMSLQSVQSSMRPGALSTDSGGSMSQWALDSHAPVPSAQNDCSAGKKSHLSECAVSLPNLSDPPTSLQSVGSSLVLPEPTSPPSSFCSFKPESPSSSMRPNGVPSPLSSVRPPPVILDDVSLSLASHTSSMICCGAPSPMASSMCSSKPPQRPLSAFMRRPDSVRVTDDHVTTKSACSFGLSLASRQSSLAPVLGDPGDNVLSCPLGRNSATACSDGASASSLGASLEFRYHGSQFSASSISPKNGVDPRDTLVADFFSISAEDAPLFGSTPAATILPHTAAPSLQADAGSEYSPRSMTTPQIRFISTTKHVGDEDETACFFSLNSVTQSNASPRSLQTFLRASSAGEDMDAPTRGAECNTENMPLTPKEQRQARNVRSRSGDINAHALAVPHKYGKAMTPSTDEQEEMEENDIPEAFFSDDAISMVSFPGSEESVMQQRDTVTPLSSNRDTRRRPSTVCSISS